MSQQAYLALLEKYDGDLTRASLKEMYEASGSLRTRHHSAADLAAAKRQWAKKAQQAVPAEIYRDSQR